jgi:hypothetical protein
MPKLRREDGTHLPAFEKGFGTYDSPRKWEYMMAVFSNSSRRIGHGAFENGLRIRVDILKRIKKLAEKTENYLHCAYRGAMPDVPERNFTPLDLKTVTNVNYPTPNAKRDGKWIGYGSINGIKTFYDIPFEILNPDEMPHTSIRLSMLENKTAQVTTA